MGLAITSIVDALKTFAQSLQLSSLFPALVFVVINMGVVVPAISPSVSGDIADETLFITGAFITVMLSYTLYAFNNPLIRLAEGYIGSGTPWMVESLTKQVEQFRNLRQRKYSHLSHPRGREALQVLDMHFPSQEHDVLPTTLGNTIAAFEDYPYERYGLDAVVLWPRLLPVLRNNKFVELVSQEKVAFDFLLNMMYVALICGIEITYLLFYLNQLVWIIPCVLLTWFLVRLLYAGAINGAVQWGLTVRVAFDIHRGELRDELQLKPVASYREEVSQWQEMSQFVLLGDEKRVFNGFVYDTKDHNSLPPKTEEEKGEEAG